MLTKKAKVPQGPQGQTEPSQTKQAEPGKKE